MKKCISIIGFLLFVPWILLAQTPHPVLGQLLFQANEEPPADHIISFEAYLSNNSEEIRTQDSLGCAYENGIWTVECANFETAWQAGDTLFIRFFVVGLTETYSDEVALTNNAYDNGGITYITQVAAENVTPTLQKNMQLDFYPNPFNPEGVIRFNLPKDQLVDVGIYNIKGQQVRQYPRRIYEAGEQQLLWNGTNQMGKSVASGVYLIRVKTDENEQSKKILLLK